MLVKEYSYYCPECESVYLVPGDERPAACYPDCTDGIPKAT